MADNPYTSQPPKAFWKSAISTRSMFDISDLWTPKFNIKDTDRVATYGSCFAQHFGRALRARKYFWYIAEKQPFGLNDENATRFNYGLFSSRTGNIYTTSMLKQWCEWALADKTLPNEIWEENGRFIDPIRPAIEPDGFESKAELLTSRQIALDAFRQSVKRADVFVFTLGLTEQWRNTQTGFEYPICPGTIAGQFDPGRHKFNNMDFTEVQQNLIEAISFLKETNPDLKILLTVSPVPLTATATKQHALVATTYSKSVLRAVAGQIAETSDDVDYFPSYEIINTAPFRGAFFEPNQRQVNPEGVRFVMRSFFDCQAQKFGKSRRKRKALAKQPTQNDDLVCEEQMLAAFQGDT